MAAGLLVANRGEIAIRVLRAGAELGLRTVAVYAEDDAGSLHTRMADTALPLRGSGPGAYLDGEQLVARAREAGCALVHPGYGFLSENAAFARRCEAWGLRFVGPSAELLERFGDKLEARRIAEKTGVPVLTGSAVLDSPEAALRFWESLPAGAGLMLKAVAGGGGRGVRAVQQPDALEDAFARCSSEARAAFGSGALYAEEWLPRPRHIEIQMVGDGSGAAVALGDRDCSLQRRHQKLVEIAPAPGLEPALRAQIADAARRMAESVAYESLGTFEFLVASASAGRDGATRFAFIEANPRLQVEHTVTEAVLGVDLVRMQLELAQGAALGCLELDPASPPQPRGFAIQCRVNLETMRPDGNALPAAGTLHAFEPPSGPGVRVDHCGYAGYSTSMRYDALLAKVIGHSSAPDLEVARARTARALSEFRIAGAPTNLAFLQSLLAHPALGTGAIDTGFIDAHAAALVEAAAQQPRRGAPAQSAELADADVSAARAADAPSGRAGARVDAVDPLAVLTYGQRRASGTEPAAAPPGPENASAVPSPLHGTVVSLAVAEGDAVQSGALLAVVEAMKMEHEVRAPHAGRVERLCAQRGETLLEGHPLLFLEEIDSADAAPETDEAVDLDAIRPDLAEVLERRAATLDAARPEAVAKRHARGLRTVRENVEDLVDPGSFVEYGALALAGQRRRREVDDLIRRSPADGLITGVASINGELFAEPAARCAVMAYDYTVFAGTQGVHNHRKTDRLIDVAEQGRLPLVLFAEGGGGRPGDSDGIPGDTPPTFARFAQLSGLVPMVGIAAGRCFAGNASLLGCCDAIIATAGANIGMGGPAMIEGGGLGVFAPEEIGAMDVQVPNGVVDLAVSDEAEAVRVARQYLAYFQGRLASWEAADAREMRSIVPENRLRVYDVRRVIQTLADRCTVLELRPRFGPGMVTALVRVEGRTLGVIANNPEHLGGAIDADGADKASRFMQLCDAFDVPLLYLCDTPGIMVGPEIEKTALVRHSSRMFVTGANLSVPFFTIVLRKAYGLGAIAMAGGAYNVPFSTVSWPTGEFGGMGLEGAVKLGFRAELAAIDDPAERRAAFDRLVAAAYRGGKALNMASLFHVDDVIDPADSRPWLASLLRSLPAPSPRAGKKRPSIDAW